MTAREAAALAYAARNWRVLILEPDGKAPNTDPKACPRGVKDATIDPGRIRSWLWRFPESNIGIATGPPGPIVQDVDDLDAARSAIAGIAKGTPTVATPGDHHPPGLHFYFSGSHPSRDCGWGELRGRGYYVVAPPSAIPAGVYVWTVEPNGALPDLPSHLVPPRASGAGAGELPARAGRVPHGQRHAHLKDMAVRLARAGVVDEARMLAHLLLEFDQCCEPDPPRAPGGIEALATWAVESDIAGRERRLR